MRGFQIFATFPLLFVFVFLNTRSNADASDGKTIVVNFSLAGTILPTSVPSGTTVLECFQWLSSSVERSKGTQIAIRRGAQLFIVKEEDASDPTFGGRMTIQGGDEITLVMPLKLTPEEKRQMMFDLEGFLRRKAEQLDK